MTAIEAYILAKKIALGAVSGIQNITLSPTGTLIFQFKNGTQTSWQIPLPKDGIDGISITNVEIDSNNHLICTLSDDTTIDAGEIPGEKGGGLIQANGVANFPSQGETDTLYLDLKEEILYYWNNIKTSYQPISSGTSASGIDFCKDSIAFNGVETTFDLPIDNKDIMVYINGIYLTEDEDYTLDRTISPNQITFLETWEPEDLCTLVWVKGSTSGETSDDIIITLAKEEDIDNLFKESGV